MADIDRALFAEQLAAALKMLGVSQGEAVRRWPNALNAAMLSRAVNAKPLTPGNFLLLCGLFHLDPFEFLIVVKRSRTTLKSIVKQTLTEGVKRETGEPPCA